MTELLRPIDIEKMAKHNSTYVSIETGSSRHILIYRYINCVVAYFIISNIAFIILKYKNKYVAYRFFEEQYREISLLTVIKIIEEVKYNPNIKLLDENIKNIIIEKEILNKI